MNILRRKVGEINLTTIVISAVAMIFVMVVFGAINLITTSSAISTLTGKGYVVLASSEYDTLNSKLDALKISADAAVVNAEAAALAAESTLDTLLLHTESVTYLYPENVAETCTLTSGTPANTFGAWAELTTNGSVTLSSKFSANDGYIKDIITRSYSAANKVYIIELSYGAAKTSIGRVKLMSDWTYVLALNSASIPTGETVYYRMKSETASATLIADFLYYYDL